MRKRKLNEPNLEDIAKDNINLDDEGMLENELPVEVILIKEPHTMMVPSEEGILIISGDFYNAELDEDFPYTMVIDFYTMEKLYSYMKMREAEINFGKYKY